MSTDTGPTAERSVLRVVLGAPRAVWILVAGVFVNRVGSFFATFATLFLTERGFALAELPAVLVAIGVAGMVGSLGGGWLADRVGHRAALVTAMLASAGALTLLALAQDRGLVIVAVCLVALFTQSYVPAASALLVENSAPQDRVPTFALFRLALNVGAAIGPLLAGLLATQSYTLLFGINAASCVLSGLVIAFGLPRGPVRSDMRVADPDGSGVRSGPPPVGGGATAWALCMLLFAVAMIYAQHQSTLPLQLADREFPTTLYGALLTLNGFLVIVGELPISGITRRLPWHVPLSVGVLLMTAGLVVAGLSGSVVLVVVGFAVFTVGEMVFAPVANAAVAAVSPPGTTARYQGLLATAQTLGFSLGPAVGAAVFALGGTGLWTGVAVLAVLLAVGVYVVRRLSS